MVIGGFQKLTLLDYPGQTACLIFTAGCNFRCAYCHNASLTTGEASCRETEETEIFTYLKKRQKLLDGVVISGGEPLLHKDIRELICRIKDLGYDVKLDTNGSFPERLQELISENLLDYVAMDLKTCPADYQELSGCQDKTVWQKVSQSMNILKTSGVTHEFRTTLVRGIHTVEDVRSIASVIRNSAPYYLQSYVDSGDILNPEGLSSFTAEELEQILLAAKNVCPQVTLRNG